MSGPFPAGDENGARPLLINNQNSFQVVIFMLPDTGKHFGRENVLAFALQVGVLHGDVGESFDRFQHTGQRKTSFLRNPQARAWLENGVNGDDLS